MSALTPGFKHVFLLADGEVLEAFPPHARRVVDVRSTGSRPETVWEITLPSGLIRRVWLDEITSWKQVDV